MGGDLDLHLEDVVCRSRHQQLLMKIKNFNCSLRGAVVPRKHSLLRVTCTVPQVDQNQYYETVVTIIRSTGVVTIETIGQ